MFISSGFGGVGDVGRGRVSSPGDYFVAELPVENNMIRSDRHSFSPQQSDESQSIIACFEAASELSRARADPRRLTMSSELDRLHLKFCAV
jgi:hypothetical protein